MELSKRKDQVVPKKSTKVKDQIFGKMVTKKMWSKDFYVKLD